MSLDNYGSMGSVEGSASRDDETLLGKGAVKERDEKITKDAYIFVLCAALNSCNLGYDVGVSTKVGRLVQKDFQLSRLEREIFIGSINFWASKSADDDSDVATVAFLKRMQCLGLWERTT